VWVLVRSPSLVSVDTRAIARASIAPVPISWGLPSSHDRNGFETSARRKCCSIVSRKRMGLRRFRNPLRAVLARAHPASCGRWKNNSALIFEVFTLASVWRLMVFEAL
jgi:hypothetical protein